ncbi:MAG: hypothetical protein ACE5R4_07190 [Armatimonadota bacterium]
MRTSTALCLILLLACGALGTAQQYSFSVPEMLLSVYVNPDASVRMEYDILFACSPGAHAIDVVDVGLPHKGYDISNMSAAVNGVPVSGITKSTYIDTGVEVPLGGQTIRPGQSGRFTFVCTMPDLVYQDTTREDNASLRITPTWFDASLLQGTTELGVVVYLPQDINPEEVLYHRREFSLRERTENHTVAGWHMPGVRVDREHMVGLSFPKRNMERVVKMTRFGLLMKWWQESPNVRAIYGAVVLILFGIMFFRASRGTGCPIFVILAAALAAAFYFSPVVELLALPAVLLLLYVSETLIKQRRSHYLPAIASVEGGGVKRGLTAPEAGMIRELPLGRLLTMVIFGLLRKGVLQQVSADPLVVKVAPEYAGKTRAERRKVARQLGTVHHGYEQPFIEAIEKNPGRPVAQIDFNEAMKECVKRTAERMNGFDLERTREYYDYQADRAWAEANVIENPELRTRYVDDHLLWMLTDEERYDEFDRWHRTGFYYRPVWTRTEAPTAPAAAAPETPVGGRTTFTDVAESFAGWTENLTGRLASKLDPGSVSLRDGGIVDLSGVDKVTMEALKSMAESSGSGGGGGGGCACACAGCACACACAGGGR